MQSAINNALERDYRLLRLGLPQRALGSREKALTAECAPKRLRRSAEKGKRPDTAKTGDVPDQFPGDFLGLPGSITSAGVQESKDELSSHS
jgi:hypothetical protein